MTYARQVVLDTETTGLEWRQGDRVIEIGCVEMMHRRLSGRNFHCYLNPQRPISAGAQAVHGLSDEFLAQQPKFASVADEFLAFVKDAELIIHNASFDVGFLDNELALIDKATLADSCAAITDTLKMARELRPGKKNNLNVLCSEYGIDNSERQLHGALLDAELLAGVYLAMTRGQDTLLMDGDMTSGEPHDFSPSERPPIRVIRPSPEELQEHARVMQELERASGGKVVWPQAE